MLLEQVTYLLQVHVFCLCYGYKFFACQTSFVIAYSVEWKHICTLELSSDCLKNFFNCVNPSSLRAFAI